MHKNQVHIGALEEPLCLIHAEEFIFFSAKVGDGDFRLVKTLGHEEIRFALTCNMSDGLNFFIGLWIDKRDYNLLVAKEKIIAVRS